MRIVFLSCDQEKVSVWGHEGAKTFFDILAHAFGKPRLNASVYVGLGFRV